MNRELKVMVRPRRMEFSGALYHISARGNARQTIYFDNDNGYSSGNMRYHDGVYSQYLNRKSHRIGHVFQGRYKAILVGKES